MENSNLKKGVSLYLVIVIISILLAVSLNAASLIIGGAKIIKGAADSVKAFYAADTGIEEALYNAKNSTCNDIVNGTVGGDANYVYNVDISYTGEDCTDTGTTMLSVGEFKPGGASSAKRKISIIY
ncbi:MAG: hypothetical protein PHO90_00010 [Candidatus Pacebacteria bacterium]|nr:hypothetical protein [Candidatus Paceibacterota bacterium]